MLQSNFAVVGSCKLNYFKINFSIFRLRKIISDISSFNFKVL